MLAKKDELYVIEGGGEGDVGFDAIDKVKACIKCFGEPDTTDALELQRSELEWMQ